MREVTTITTLAVFVTLMGVINLTEGTSHETLSSPPVQALEPSWTVDKQTVFLFELAIFVIVVVYIVVFIIGRHQNLALAIDISSTLRTALGQQFVQFGHDGKKMHRDGHSIFWFYATGRRNTTGLTACLDLAKRMDMFSYTAAFMATPHKDRAIFYLPLARDVHMEPLTLFVVKRKELTRLRAIDDGNAVAAVETLAAEVIDVPGLSPDFVTMTEHVDIVTALLPESLREIIARHRANVLSVHVTEQGAQWDAQSLMSDRLIRVEFTLPNSDSQRDALLCDMCRIGLHLVDLVANTKLPPAARKKAIDLRRLIVSEREKAEQKARAEEAAARRLEKKKEEEEAVGKMSAEKQRKYEERKRKKEINARMRKATKK